MRRPKSRLVFIMAMAFALIVCGLAGNRMRIREIPDVEDWVSFPYDMEVVVKCYLIDNPPTDFDELRDLAEKQIDNRLHQIVSSGDVQTMYKCFFFRVSKHLPWYWRENNAHMTEDHIEHHIGDMIISVSWTSEDSLRKYSIMERSDSQDDYGSILREVTYEGKSMKQEN